jgi:hypothetical protein
MAAVGSVSERLTACKLDVERLKAAIDAKKSALQNGGLRDVDAHYRPLGPALKRRRTLAGHHGKVYACDWAVDGETVVSTGCVPSRSIPLRPVATNASSFRTLTAPFCSDVQSRQQTITLGPERESQACM